MMVTVGWCHHFVDLTVVLNQNQKTLSLCALVVSSGRVDGGTGEGFFCLAEHTDIYSTLLYFHFAIQKGAVLKRCYYYIYWAY